MIKIVGYSHSSLCRVFSCDSVHTRISIVALMLLAIMVATGCGTSSRNSASSGLLAANWQFTLNAPADGSFNGGTQANCGTSTTNPCPIQLGGFLLQNSNSVTGSLTYSIALANQKTGTFPCSGSGPVSGTVNGQTVNLTLQAGPQTLSLNGTISADGKTMIGTYSSVDAQGCGTAQNGLQWSAVSIPALSGAVQGVIHSKAVHAQFNPDFPSNEAFPVSGVLNQGPNTGASNATVTGTLTFQGGYPCLGSVASVNGQISGSSLILQIVAGNGLDVGQIGTPLSSAKSGQAPAPVTVQSTPQGLLFGGADGYTVTSKKCPGSPGDSGNICIALGGATTCTQPVLLTPAALTFPPQLLGSTTSQTITLTNNDPSGASLTGLTLSFNPTAGFTPSFINNSPSDFSGLPNFVWQNTCSSSVSNNTTAPFTLAAGQSCTITVSFSPQQSCPWLPFSASGSGPSGAGAAPTACPVASTASLTVNTNSKSGSTGTDTDTAFTVPIQGTGMSLVTVYPAELDFGSEAVSERSPAQSVTFTNQGQSAVDILPASGNAVCGSPGQLVSLPRPLAPNVVPGFLVVDGSTGQFGNVQADPNVLTVDYVCDLDPTSKQPNFQISNDSCSGARLMPGQSCSLAVSFAPQPGTALVSGLDDFLEFNTLQCSGVTTVDCEMDAGRFPVELKANLPSPLRMTPGSGLDFGVQPVGQTSGPLTVTLFNDPKDPNTGTVNLSGNRVKGDYFETDNCGTSLAPGASCTLTVTFTPQGTGSDPGSISIGYSVGNTFELPQTIYLRGTGQ